VQDDTYALGAIMFFTLSGVNSILELEPAALGAFLDVLAPELGLPEAERRLIETLMDPNEANRPTAAEVAAQLDRDPRLHPARPQRPLPSDDELCETVEGILSHISAVADPARADRLFPGDLLLHQTNPLSVAHGAAGVLLAVHRIRGDVPGQWLTWLLSQPGSAELVPPGLYLGTAGIAWALDEIGQLEPALRFMEATSNHPLLDAPDGPSDLLHGHAGIGLANLRLFDSTGDRGFLEEAVARGESVLGSARDDEGLLSWPDEKATVRVGYARGASGVALFLLHLHQATGQARWLDAGRRALEFDLRHAVDIDGRLTFPRTTESTIRSPYLHTGTAGVAATTLRYLKATGDEALRERLVRMIPDVSRRYTINPGLFNGLAGLGNVLLDCRDIRGDQDYGLEARAVAGAILRYRVRRPGGVAFPGDGLFRLSTDFATGSAGIALFLHRLVNGGPDFNLTLPDLTPARTRGGSSELPQPAFVG